MENLSADDIATMIYLGAFAVLLTGVYLAQSRLKASQMLQQGAIWVFIFIGAIAAAGLWQEISDDVIPRQTVAIDGGDAIITAPRARDGHYYLTLMINGTPTRFVVDTGATDLVLSKKDAAAAGLDLQTLAFLGRANTANGQVRTAMVRLDTVEVGALRDENVRAVVNEGDMDTSLLGMSYLEHFGRIEISGGDLTLTR